MSDQPINVTILDTVTGQRATCDKFSQAWWEYSSSCDCNRCIQFDDGTIPECDDCHVDGKGDSRCCGARRFLIVEASVGDLAEMNSDYPAELVKRWLP